MVEITTSAERMSLSLFLSAGRGGSAGEAALKEAGEVEGPPFPSYLGGRFGGTPCAPGGGFWGIALTFLPAAFLSRLSTTSTVLELTLTALPLTICAWVKAERVFGLLITIPRPGGGGPGEGEGVWGLELAI